jgi:hypothetical protein
MLMTIVLTVGELGMDCDVGFTPIAYDGRGTTRAFPGDQPANRRIESHVWPSHTRLLLPTNIHA